MSNNDKENGNENVKLRWTPTLGQDLGGNKL